MSSKTVDRTADPYELIFERLNPIVGFELSNTTPTIINSTCEFCLRSGKDFHNSGVIWIDSYNYSSHICKTCNLFSEQLPITLGIERGSIGYKISSFKSGLLALPTDKMKPIELWIGGKYLERINHASEIKIVDCSGNLAKYAMCESIGSYSVVTEISLRREMFLRHIRTSSTEDMFISGESGVVHLNAKTYLDLKTAIIEEDMSKKEFTAFIDILNAHKKGRLPTTHSDVQKTISQLSPKLVKALSAIPDPNSLIFILAGLKAGLTLNEAE